MKTITAEELKKMLDKGEVTLIDVREPSEHKAVCINGACLIPLNQIDISKLPSRSKPIVIHCHSGARSAKACEILLQQDPTLEIYNLEGGICAWQQADFNTQKTGAKTLPFDQQTQLALGIILFVGIALGAIISPLFDIIPALVGLGLIMAGITGSCGLSKIIAKMPWNQ